MKMTDADAEASETTVWLDFAKDCDYLDTATHERTYEIYKEVGRMLGGMARNPEKFKPR
jgi:four helix bundle protein